MAGQDELPEMLEFVDEFDLNDFDHVADPTGRVWQMFKIRSQPSYVFINDSGEIVHESGSLDTDALAERIQALIDT